MAMRSQGIDFMSQDLQDVLYEQMGLSRSSSPGVLLHHLLESSHTDRKRLGTQFARQLAVWVERLLMKKGIGQTKSVKLLRTLSGPSGRKRRRLDSRTVIDIAEQSGVHPGTALRLDHSAEKDVSFTCATVHEDLLRRVCFEIAYSLQGRS